MKIRDGRPENLKKNDYPSFLQEECWTMMIKWPQQKQEKKNMAADLIAREKEGPFRNQGQLSHCTRST